MIQNESSERGGGDYLIDHSHFKVNFTSEEKENRTHPLRTIIYYPSCKYMVSIYQAPKKIIKSYIQMFLLACIVMFMFVKPFDINTMIICMSVVLLTYKALIPYLMSVTPSVSCVTFSCYLVYSNLIGYSITLLYTFLGFGNTAEKTN